jgi:hypothetical protein
MNVSPARWGWSRFMRPPVEDHALIGLTEAIETQRDREVHVFCYEPSAGLQGLHHLVEHGFAFGDVLEYVAGVNEVVRRYLYRFFDDVVLSDLEIRRGDAFQEPRIEVGRHDMSRVPGQPIRDRAAAAADF